MHTVTIRLSQPETIDVAHTASCRAERLLDAAQNGYYMARRTTTTMSVVNDAYVPRLADGVLHELVGAHAAVSVTGPRATGKTTTSARVVNSELRLGVPAVARAVAADPGVALSNRDEPLLIDEWQIVPDTLAAIKETVDRDSRAGRFIITGSVRAELDTATWPATGRVVGLRMYGLTEAEIERRTGARSWLEAVLGGAVPSVRSSLDIGDYVRRALASGFPEARLRLDGPARYRWLASYVEQLVTRDAETIASGRDPTRVRRYLEALALNSSGVVNDITLTEAAGVSKDTGRAYDALLANLLVLDKIPAWSTSRLKRLVRNPKRLLVDAGLFTGVLGVTADDVLLDGDLLGRVIETFVIAQIRAEAALRVPMPRLHHLRTAGGRHEVDLVIEVGPRKLIAIEIKATSSPTRADATHLRWLRDEFGDAVVASVLLHAGPESFEIDRGVVAAPIASVWSAEAS